MQDASGKIDGAYRKLAALGRLKEVKARMEDRQILPGFRRVAHSQV